MNTMGSHRLRLILIIAFTAVVLGVGTTAVLAAGGPRSLRGPIQSAWPPSCATPTLTGAVVDVTLTGDGYRQDAVPAAARFEVEQGVLSGRAVTAGALGDVALDHRWSIPASVHVAAGEPDPL